MAEGAAGKPAMRIGDVDLGDRTLIIAEVGSNHCGDPDLARRSLIAAAESGADVVKFQMYDPDKLVEPMAPVLSYIAQTHGSQRERFRSLYLSRDVFTELAELACRLGVMFLVTPFDEEAVDFLDPLVPAFKIASGDLTNVRLLRRVVETGKPVIVSTGFSTVAEIDWLVSQVPNDQLCLMHCIGAYPTPPEQVHLESIRFLADRYHVPVGFSDHTAGITASLAAVAKGAQIIEKHFLLSRDLMVADSALSTIPEEFTDLVAGIRQIERMHGIYGKSVQPSEEYFRTQLRRSVYAVRNLNVGETVSSDDVFPLRPLVAGAIGARDIERMLGRVLVKPVMKDHPLFDEAFASESPEQGGPCTSP